MKHIENDQMNMGYRTEYGVVLEESASELTQGGWGTWGEGTGKYHNK